jgi:hypothetical protein
MKRLSIAIAFAAFATVAAAQEAPTPTVKWTGCYGQAGASGNLFRAAGESSSLAAFGVGIGCDYRFPANMVAGASVGYDFGRDSYRALVLSGRVGYLVNPSLLVYGKLATTLDGVSPSFSGAVYAAGGGVETAIGTSNVTVFLEADTKVGQSDAADRMWSVRAGARVRF